MNELITVIINVYNGEKYIKKCLDCVINQTYNNLEILIINDGSKDNTLEIVKEYKDKRIKVITTKNQGLSLSRNTGIKNAKGEYLFFLDVDDYIDLDTLEYLYNLINKYNTKISTCETSIVYKTENKKNIKEDTHIETSLDMVKKVLLSTNRHGAIWNKLMKKELFNDLLFEDRIINDMVVVYKLFLKVDNVAYTNLEKYYYIKNDNSITSKKNIERAIDSYKAAIERYDYIEKIYPNMIENKIAVLLTIVDIYNHNNEKIDKYIKDNNINKLFKKYYSLKIFKTKITRRNKVKIFLYRINPKIERFFQKHKKKELII